LLIITECIAEDDTIIFGKNKEGATTGADFQKHMTGNKVVDAGQQGKYFYMIMAKPPHPVLHFGMTGWMDFKSEHTYYYRPKPGEEAPEFPPRFWKFQLETKPEKGEEKEECAFKDPRRLSRVRLIDCEADKIRQVPPLSANGPDPVIDKEKVSLEWLSAKCKSKQVPIKAMLLDQAVISGIGNWVGDEIMYNAKMHPEQYAYTLKDDQIKQLHKSIHYVCGTACELLGDSDKFPEDWLFKHRWGKGKKDASAFLPNGEKIVFLTVGGRTSAVVPSIQKKTGPVAAEMDEAVVKDEDGVEKKVKETKKKRKAKEEDEDGHKEEEIKSKKKATVKKAKEQSEPVVNGDAPKSNGTTPKKIKEKAEVPVEGRRRSARIVPVSS
jgi:formamidopyrimidine-DNA glycosylase